MPHRFKIHYTREEAVALIPQLRAWLERLVELRNDLTKMDQRLQGRLSAGDDVGGETVNRSLRALVATQEVLAEFHQREILIKDLDRGLVDFPAIIGGREVFLCWEKDEEDVEHWHELDAGFAGRERLE